MPNISYQLEGDKKFVCGPWQLSRNDSDLWLPFTCEYPDTVNMWVGGGTVLGGWWIVDWVSVGSKNSLIMLGPNICFRNRNMHEIQGVPQNLIQFVFDQ